MEVDPTGVAIREARPEIVQRLPRIVAPGVKALNPGAPSSSPEVNMAVQAVYRLKSAPTSPLEKIDIDSLGNLCLNMIDSIKVRLGGIDEMSTKLDKLTSVYQANPQIARKLTEINLVVPEQPACIERASTPKVASPAIGEG